MKTTILTLFIVLNFISTIMYSQQTDTLDYIEFNDRRNILHGIYLGLDIGYGEIDGRNNTPILGAKLAYVANRRMELGFAVRGFYSELKDVDRSFNSDFDAYGIYGGFHIENVIFDKRKVKLSIPLLLGIGYIQGSGPFLKNSDMMGVLEPGLNALYNVNKYVQFECGLKYRFSTPIDPVPNVIDNINGLSFIIGTKVGVFNLGKNRYKKQLKTNQK